MSILGSHIFQYLPELHEPPDRIFESISIARSGGTAYDSLVTTHHPGVIPGLLKVKTVRFYRLEQFSTLTSPLWHIISFVLMAFSSWWQKDHRI